MTITIRSLQEHIGAKVEGVDLTLPINAQTFTRLRKALYKYAVLVFPGQDITDEQQVAFSRDDNGKRSLWRWWANQPNLQC